MRTNVLPLTSFATMSLAAIACLGLHLHVHAATFRGLGVPQGASSSGATGVSDDGSIVVGTVPFSPNGAIIRLGSEVFRWTDTFDMDVIGDLPGGFLFAREPRVSDNGVIIATGSNAFNRETPARWTESTGWEALDADWGFAEDITPDGSVVVGSLGQRAFRWTEVTGFEFLEGLHDLRYASAVSADGNTIAGHAAWYDGSRYRGESFRWTAANGMVGLGHLPEDDYNAATAISADGSVVVGSYFSFDDFARRGYRWTQETGMEPLGAPLGTLPVSGESMGAPRAVSGNGEVIVGGGYL